MYEKYAMKKWVLFIAAILTLCSSVVRADDPNDSNKKAIEIYSALAARYMLAKIYLNGEGVTQDYKKALLPRCRGNTKLSGGGEMVPSCCRTRRLEFESYVCKDLFKW